MGSPHFMRTSMVVSPAKTISRPHLNEKAMLLDEIKITRREVRIVPIHKSFMGAGEFPIQK